MKTLLYHIRTQYFQVTSSSSHLLRHRLAISLFSTTCLHIYQNTFCSTNMFARVYFPAKRLPQLVHFRENIAYPLSSRSCTGTCPTERTRLRRNRTALDPARARPLSPSSRQVRSARERQPHADCIKKKSIAEAYAAAVTSIIERLRINNKSRPASSAK